MERIKDGRAREGDRTVTGLQRATEAARATRGLPPRPVHLRSLSGGNNATCGRGGVTFSAPIADDPAEVTCKNCVKAAVRSRRWAVNDT